MGASWNYQDIVDFEYFLFLDKSQLDHVDLHSRDRGFYLDLEKATPAIETHPQKEILYNWLQFRKTDHPPSDQSLPGQIIGEILKILSFLLPIVGLLVGCGLGISYFTYTGTAPLNVFHFFAAFILLQIVLVFSLLLTFFFQAGKKRVSSSIFYRLLAKALTQIIYRTQKRSQNILSETRQEAFKIAVKIFQDGKGYGPLFYWPLFNRIQFFSISVNLGLLFITLFSIASTDLAFGWQSTIQLSSETIHSGVRFLALPWSWLLQHPSPTLSEIEGSRMILKDGMYHLATVNLTSWWPFLTASLVVYGLLPRILLLTAGLLLERYTLTRLNFKGEAQKSLFQRMLTPLFSTQATPEIKDAHHSSSQPKQQEPHNTTQSTKTSVIVLIPDDIFTTCSQTELTHYLLNLNFDMEGTIRFGESFEADMALLSNLQDKPWKQEDGIFILMEAWMPPIEDFTSFIKELRAHLPVTTKIHVGLIGKPNPDTIFTEVQEKDCTLWQKKLSTTKTSSLFVEKLVNS